MSRSQDPDHFFQTSQSLAESSRKAAKANNEHGAPIRLKSKILAVIIDPTHDGALYLAESAGQVRRIVLDTGESTNIYRGPTAPLTSLALSPDNTILFAGSWDKTVWSWSKSSSNSSAGHNFKGHTDFVKAVLCTRLASSTSTSRPFDILISGSADATVIIWDVSSGTKLQTLVGYYRGIFCLAIDPLSYPEEESETADESNEGLTLFGGGSEREIRRWKLSSNMSAPPNKARSNILPNGPPILEHETSVYAIQFDADGDLWTASADGTVKCLSRADDWKADTSLLHGDYVRAVALHETKGLVISAGRDEDVKLWDKASGKLVFAYKGHFDEVTGLVVLKKAGVVVSVGIDGTIRNWSLKSEDIDRARQEREDEEKGLGGDKDLVQGMESLVTEDEDKELAELMEDDE